MDYDLTTSVVKFFLKKTLNLVLIIWDLFRKMFAQVTFHNPQEMRHRQPYFMIKETYLTSLLFVSKCSLSECESHKYAFYEEQ